MTQDEYDDKIGWIDNHVYRHGLMSNGLIEDNWKNNWAEIFLHDIKIGSYLLYKQKKWKVISMHRLYGFLDVEASNGTLMTIVEVSRVEVCNPGNDNQVPA